MDNSGQISVFIERQLWGYKDVDPPPDCAAALPLIVFKLIASCPSNPKLLALSQIVLGAFFFAMRSCEYVKKRKVGKTKKLLVNNVKFYNSPRLMCLSEDFE